MSKTTIVNLVLLGILIVLAGAYFAGRDDKAGQVSGPSPRLFPDLNKEAARLIIIEGGWKDRSYVFAKLGSAWHLASGGGFQAKADTAETLLDAVWNLRSENPVSDSLEVRKSTRTDEGGRLVLIYADDPEAEPMASFCIGYLS